MAVWDTSIVSRLRPGQELLRRAEHAALVGSPVRVTAPTVHEVAFGNRRRIDDARSRAAAGWFSRAFRCGLFDLVPTTGHAAYLSGAIRAEMPVPPPAERRRSPRSKPERRVAWVHDIEIASVAWLNGEAVHTADVEHFMALSDLLARLFPREQTLRVLPAPA